MMQSYGLVCAGVKRTDSLAAKSLSIVSQEAGISVTSKIPHTNGANWI